VPIVTAPNTIEVSDFKQGWVPDAEPAAAPPGSLIECINLLPDKTTGALQTRMGYERIIDALPADYYCTALFPWQTPYGLYIMAVLSSGGYGTPTDMLYLLSASALESGPVTQYEVSGGTFDPVTMGPTWAKVIGQKMYIGDINNRMVSYDINTDEFDPDPSVHNFPWYIDWVDTMAFGDAQHTVLHVTATANNPGDQLKIRFRSGKWTTIAWDATAAAWKTALENRGDIKTGNVLVDKNADGDYDIVFVRKLGWQDLPNFAVDAYQCTGALSEKVQRGKGARPYDYAFKDGDRVVWVNDIPDGGTWAGDDQAYRVAQRVPKGGEKRDDPDRLPEELTHQPQGSLRSKPWKSGRKYKAGQKVTALLHWGDDDSGLATGEEEVWYPRTFRCIEDHTASPKTKPDPGNFQTGANEKWHLNLEGNKGWFTMSFGRGDRKRNILYEEDTNVFVKRLPWNITAAALQGVEADGTGLEALFGDGNVTVTELNSVTNTIWKLKTRATGGEWKMWIDGERVLDVVDGDKRFDWNISNAALEDALESVSFIGAGNVQVTNVNNGSPRIDGDGVYVEFIGDLAGNKVVRPEIDDTLLTGTRDTLTWKLHQRPSEGRKVFEIEFVGDYAETDMPGRFEVNDRKLSGQADVELVRNGQPEGWDFWVPVVLSLPRDENGDPQADWDFVQTAAKTSIAEWWGNRLWLRYDDLGGAEGTNLNLIGYNRLQFSAPMKPSLDKKGSEYGWFEFDPQLFDIGDTIDGESGGFIDFHGDSGEPISALYGFDQTLFVFKQTSTWVITSPDANQMVVKRLAEDVGCVGPKAVTSHEGLVYFMSKKGLFQTDGTQVAPVEGNLNVEEEIREYLDAVTHDNPTVQDCVSMLSYEGRIWIAFTGGSQIYVPLIPAIVYDTTTKSFFPLDLEIGAMCRGQVSGKDRLFFAKPSVVAVAAPATPPDWDSGTPETHGPSTYDLGGPDETVNYLSDPSWEPEGKIPSPRRNRHKKFLAEAKADMAWQVTESEWTKYSLSFKAKRRGKVGAVVSNLRPWPHWDYLLTDQDTRDQIPATPGVPGTRPAEQQSLMEGLYQYITGLTGSTIYEFSYFVRRANWKKDRNIDWGVSRPFWMDDTAQGILDPEYLPYWWDNDWLDATDVTYTPMKRGWVKVTTTFETMVGQTTMYVGMLAMPQTTLQFDCAMVKEAAAPFDYYFDGDGFDSFFDAETFADSTDSLVYLYDHPNRALEPMDDGADTDLVYEPISWGMRTSWFSFGTLNEQRRIRRIWALVRSAVPVVLRGYRDYNNQVQFEVEDDTAPQSYDYPVHYEGRYFRDSSAVSLEVEGIGAPAAVLGVSIDTEPRRKRYHVRTPFRQVVNN
jgi:hypothetical protein